RVDSVWDAHLDRIFREARAAGRREPREAYAADAFVAAVTEGPCKPVDVRLELTAAAIPRGHLEPGERCEINGTPVPVTTARALLDDARITALVRDGDDITTVSKPTRTIPAKLRRALEARYPVCGVKKCANDQFLEIDHLRPLEAGGLTELANTWRICPHHPHLKTYDGWVVVGEPGNWDLVPPDDPDPP
ncbi:MAG TPA: HNH endonuclease signature motif containing protein, partial [Acidimicrobiia bacterium]|nr:HNH endonuclease signature motif containing protein [Acidimicrobiia bacterium]